MLQSRRYHGIVTPLTFELCTLNLDAYVCICGSTLYHCKSYDVNLLQ